MKLTDQDLNEMVRRRTARRSATQAGCLRPEELIGLTLGELGPEERERIADHLAGCSDCSLELRLIRSLRPANAAAGLGEARAIQLPRRVWSRALALAAGLVLAAGLFWLIWPEPTPPLEPSIRAGGPRPAELTQVEPRHGAVLDEAPQRLAWEPAAAASYRVVLYDFQSTPIWESPRLATPSVVLAPELRARLERDRRYLWRVYTESGVERRPSMLFEFTIQP